MIGNPIRPDPVINTTTRLSLMAVLAAAQEVEFGAARDASGLSDSVVSKQAIALEAAGYLTGLRPSPTRRVVGGGAPVAG